ncbi:MAG: AI-2E family transporter [Bdellovibrionota bacterium]
MQDSTIKRIHRRKLIFFLGFLLAFFLGLTFVKNLLISFLLAFVGFYILSPLVDVLERKGLSRGWSAAVPFFIFLSVFGILLQLLLPLLVSQFDELKTDFPKYSDGFTRILMDLKMKISHFSDAAVAERIASQIQEYLQTLTQNIFRDIPEVVSNSLTVLVLAPFLTFFMLLDGKRWIRNILSLVPNSFFELALNLNYQISTQMGGFVRARLLETLIIGFLTWIGLIMIQFPYALFLAVLAGVLNLIPYIGPFIGAAPAFLIAMTNTGIPVNYTLLCLVYIFAQVIDMAIIVPLVVAKIVNLHPVTVVLAVMVGSQMMGILGMIISIPLASVMKVTFQSLYAHSTDFRR